MRGATAAAMLIGAALAAGCAARPGEGRPPGPIGERQALMREMAGLAGDVTEAFNIGAEGFDEAMIARSAQQIAIDAHRIPALFPSGSGGPGSRALPAIWQRWSAFSEMAAELERSAFSLSQAALSGDDEDLMEKSVKVFRHCKACHAEFRAPKAAARE